MKAENSNEIKLRDLYDSNIYVKIKSSLIEEFFAHLTKILESFRQFLYKLEKEGIIISKGSMSKIYVIK
ncbi:MAG: hypothetical protein QXD43_02615 [Candidatus Aenigmatarchaeota archaeon]